MSRKTVYPCLLCLGLFIVGGGIFPAICSATDAAWEYLVYLFPDRLTTYNSVTGGEGYAIYSRVSGAVSVFLLMLLAFYISLRCDNGRFEYTARLSDGKFSLPRGYAHYFRRYFLSDFVIALFPALFSTLPAAFIPKRLMNAGLDVPFWCGGRLVPSFGLPAALLVALSLSVFARGLAALAAVKRYRAAWLSGGI